MLSSKWNIVTYLDDKLFLLFNLAALSLKAIIGTGDWITSPFDSSEIIERRFLFNEPTLEVLPDYIYSLFGNFCFDKFFIESIKYELEFLYDENIFLVLCRGDTCYVLKFWSLTSSNWLNSFSSIIISFAYSKMLTLLSYIIFSSDYNVFSADAF